MRWALAAASLLLAAGCAQHKASADAGTKPRMRLPSYAVGTTSANFVDQSRSTPDNGSTPGHPGRNLQSDIWYPAMADPSVPETMDAPLDPRGEPYPLLVFVHGSDGISRQSTFLMQALAAKGYVVVSGNYPLTNLLTPGGESDQHCDMEVGDVSFLADQLFKMSVTMDGELYGALDPNAGFGVFGHSTGGAVTLAAAFGPDDHDARIKAAVALAPDACFFTSSFFATRSLPTMILAGTDDHYVPAGSNAVYAYALMTEPKRLGLLTGGQHLGFTDFAVNDGAETPDSNTSDITLAFAMAEGGVADCDHQSPIGMDPLMPFATQHELTVELTAAFFDAYLYDDDSSLNTIDANPPALVQWMQ